MESRKWAICSLVFALRPSNFWNFVTLYSVGKSFSATLSEYGGFRSRLFGVVAAQLRSFFNMASISTLVRYREGSSSWVTGRLDDAPCIISIHITYYHELNSYGFGSFCVISNPPNLGWNPTLNVINFTCIQNVRICNFWTSREVSAFVI